MPGSAIVERSHGPGEEHGMADSTALDAGRRPRLVTAGIALVIAAAVVNAAIGVFFVTQAVQPAIRTAQGDIEVTAGAAAGLTALAVIAAVYSAVLVVLALQLGRGRLWARPALLATSAVSLFPLVVSVSVPGILVTLLLIVADVLLYRPAVTRWQRALRGLRAG